MPPDGFVCKLTRMSMLHSGAQSAIAFQLATALEEYEQEVDRLAAARGDLDLYQQVSRRMDCMRLYAASLPPVSVPWVEVLIGHFELTHCLWRMQARQAQPVDLSAPMERQRAAVRRLREVCLARYAIPQ